MKETTLQQEPTLAERTEAILRALENLDRIEREGFTKVDAAFERAIQLTRPRKSIDPLTR